MGCDPIRLSIIVLFFLCLLLPAAAQESDGGGEVEELYPVIVEEEEEELPVDAETGLNATDGSAPPIAVSDTETEIELHQAPALYETLLWKYATVDRITAASIAADGSLAAAGTYRPGQIYVWDGNGTVQWTKGLSVPVNGISISPEGRYVAVAADRVYLFLRQGAEKWSRNTGYFAYSVAVSANGNRVAAGFDDGSIQVFDQEGREIARYAAEGNVISTAISENGSYVAGGSDDRAIYFLDSKARLLWKRVTGGSVAGVAMSADGSLVGAGSTDRVAYFFDREGALLWKYAASRRISSVSISPEGNLAAVCEGSRIHVFTAEGRPLWVFDTTNEGNYVSTTSFGALVGPEITRAAISGHHLFAGSGSGDQRVYYFSLSAVKPVPEKQMGRLAARAVGLAEVHQEYLYTGGSAQDPGEYTYMSAVTHLDRDPDGPIRVRIAAAPEWVERQPGGIAGIRIAEWSGDGSPRVLETTFVGYDLFGNVVFEAVSDNSSARFGLTSQAASGERGLFDSLFLEPGLGGVGVLVVSAVMVTFIVLRHIFRRTSRKTSSRRR